VPRGWTDEADLEFMRRESSLGTMTWGFAEPGIFLIRGKHYLRDNKKVTAIFFISMIVKCNS